VAVVAGDRAAAAAALRNARQGHAASTPPRVVVLFPGDTPFMEALQAWESLGVAPATMIGVGVGELVAATVAGVFDAATGARLAQLRERLLGTARTGALLAISASPDRFDLPGGLSLAAVNGPAASVVCGGDADLDAFAEQLAAKGITARRLAGSHPLPTPGIAEQFAEAVAQARPAIPSKPYLSTVTGLAVTAEQATDPQHWAAHLQATVLFGQCLAAALSEPAVVVECGTGQLGRFAFQYLAKGAPRPIATRPSPLLAAGQLWTHGIEVKSRSKGRRVPLPGYPYERTRHWIDPDPAAGPITRDEAAPPQGAGLPQEDGLPQGAAPPQKDGPPQGDGLARGARQGFVREESASLDGPDGMRAIWVQLLGIEGVRAEDDFFDLGGTSLLAAQLVARIREVYGVRLPMRSVFDTPTVREMAAKVAELQAAAR
jgi:acyl transferase domain-containing protein/acyl carrier protein